MLEAVAIRGTTGVQYSSKHLLVIHGIDGIFQQTKQPGCHKLQIWGLEALIYKVITKPLHNHVALASSHWFLIDPNDYG